MNIVICSPRDLAFKEHFPTINVSTPYLKYGINVGLNGERASLCLYDNPSLEYQSKPVFLFGNLNFVMDQEICEALMAAAEKVAVEQQAGFLIGPMNGSVWQDYRLPITGDQPVFAGDLKAPIYYSELLTGCGFSPIERYHTYVSGIEKAEAVITFPTEIVVRPIEKEDVLRNDTGLYELCDLAFRNNPFYSPLNKDQFTSKYLELIEKANRALTLVAQEDNQPVAFIFAYEDLLAKGTLVIKTVAKHPSHHYPGLMTNMVRLLMNTVEELGFNRAIHAFMHEENKSLVRSEDFGGTLLRSYALFAKNIEVE